MKVYIRYNQNDIKAIKWAERQKTKYENKGYTLKGTNLNTITGECTMTYLTN